jgi:hypothetical protein
LKDAWFQPLNLTCDIPVSNFAFEWVNLYRYEKAKKLKEGTKISADAEIRPGAGGRGGALQVESS